MDIRKLRKKDIESLINLYSHYTSGDNLPALDELTRIEIWEKIVENPCVSYFVSEIKDTIIASCILTITPSFIRGGKGYGFLEHVVVHNDFRKRGFAAGMIKHVLEYAWENACTEVMLLSGSNNKVAHELYRKLDFDEERKKGFIKFRK